LGRSGRAAARRAVVLITPEVWSIALRLVARHVDAAKLVVEDELASLRHRLADAHTIGRWRQVEAVVTELTRLRRRPGETLH
jgi:hypothetical protein